MMTLSQALPVRAQEIKFVQWNPDQTAKITINGVTHLAIDRAKVDEWQFALNNFGAAQAKIKELTGQLATKDHQLELKGKDVEIANQNAESFKKDFERAQEDARRNLGLAIGERTLREQLIAALPVKAKTGGVAGKILDFLDSPAGEIGMRLVIPTATFIRTMRQ